MSRPPVNPDKSVAGIAVDPLTLERVIPESKRSDGTVRKQIKIRPGFTPQEDVRRFRGTRQAQMDANALPKGHIIGWAPPPQAASASDVKPLSKAAKKNAKRREKKQEAKKEEVPDNWDDDEAEDAQAAPTKSTKESKTASSTQSPGSQDASAATEELSNKLGKLEVK
ncbi:hypothetical protein H0H87_005670 [Tephrocybe sp. NHM501043]|nr:hypothetical protein H0H87_005670 [Tephrocybe sp. NHM501043]